MASRDIDNLKDTLFPSVYTVTAVTYSRSGDSVKLTLSGDEQLVLSSEKYALMNLREGCEIPREELLKLKKAEAAFAARKKSLTLLERRAYTGAQLKMKLTEAMFPAEIIRDVIKDLTERGFLDDVQYAQAWIASQIRRKPQGRRLLYAGLVRKGVNRHDAEKMITDGYAPAEEEAQCEICLKKFAARRGWEAEELLPAVARRGFDMTLIRKVYRRLKMNR
jgi:regulatory protein